MRSIIREWFLHLVSLYLLDSVFSFIQIRNVAILLSAATTLYVLNTIGKPFLKILWLPINIITLGLFAWVLNIIVIVLVVLLVPGFSISPFHLSSIQLGRFIIPEITLKLIWTYFLFTFLLAWTLSFFHWLLVVEE